VWRIGSDFPSAVQRRIRQQFGGEIGSGRPPGSDHVALAGSARSLNRWRHGQLAVAHPQLDALRVGLHRRAHR